MVILTVACKAFADVKHKHSHGFKAWQVLIVEKPAKAQIGFQNDRLM